jgi:hypothetical protein
LLNWQRRIVPLQGKITRAAPALLIYFGISVVARTSDETSSTKSAPSTRDGTPIGLHPPAAPIVGM